MLENFESSLDENPRRIHQKGLFATAQCHLQNRKRRLAVPFGLAMHLVPLATGK